MTKKNEKAVILVLFTLTCLGIGLGVYSLALIIVSHVQIIIK
jgi:hypothetical protein